jgi:hypothetical protein
VRSGLASGQDLRREIPVLREPDRKKRQALSGVFKPHELDLIFWNGRACPGRPHPFPAFLEQARGCPGHWREDALPAFTQVMTNAQQGPASVG